MRFIAFDLLSCPCVIFFLEEKNVSVRPRRREYFFSHLNVAKCHFQKFAWLVLRIIVKAYFFSFYVPFPLFLR